MSRYWHQAEHVFWESVSPEQPPEDTTVNQFIHAALDAYDTVTQNWQRTPNEFKIVQQYRRRLWTGFQTSSGPENGTDHD